MIGPEWAVCVTRGLSAWRREVPLTSGDGWMPELVAVDERGRAVYADPDEALTLLKRLARNHPGEVFLLVPWWEKREAAVRAADAADTDDALRERRLAEEGLLDALEDVAVAEAGMRRPPEWLRSRER